MYRRDKKGMSGRVLLRLFTENGVTATSSPPLQKKGKWCLEAPSISAASGRGARTVRASSPHICFFGPVSTTRTTTTAPTLDTSSFFPIRNFWTESDAWWGERFYLPSSTVSFPICGRSDSTPDGTKLLMSWPQRRPRLSQKMSGRGAYLRIHVHCSDQFRMYRRPTVPGFQVQEERKEENSQNRAILSPPRPAPPRRPAPSLLPHSCCRRRLPPQDSTYDDNGLLFFFPRQAYNYSGS